MDLTNSSPQTVRMHRPAPHITFQNNEFEIVDAVMGEGMDLTLAKQCIENALINADTEVDLEKAGVYDGTLVTADDEDHEAEGSVK